MKYNIKMKILIHMGFFIIYLELLNYKDNSTLYIFIVSNYIGRKVHNNYL